MKKTIKILLSAFLLTITVILSFSLMASAEVKKGTLANGSKWNFDTQTGTLTISENYDFIYADDFYQKIATPYRNSVKKIITEEDAVNIKTNYDRDTYYEEPYVEFFKADLFPNLKCYIQKLPGGFSREYDPVNYVLTLNGKGKWPDEYEFYPNIKTGDGITEVGTLDAYNGTLTIGKGLKVIGEIDGIKKYEVDPKNQTFALYESCIYSKDFTKLIATPADGRTSFKFHPNLSVIGDRAFKMTEESGFTLVLPWGVTKVEGYLFELGSHSTGPVNVKIILPETLNKVPDEFGGGGLADWTYYYPKGSKFKNLEKNNLDKNSYDNGELSLKEYYSIYGVKPNSLKTFQNSKTYYFGSNYKMSKGWKKVNGTWYYFNDYGAAVVKIWLKSGGKWYYMQEDGTMATNKWIKWYNKWYYVGKDGAMYANRKTPDGYYVNANGVWVK